MTTYDGYVYFKNQNTKPVSTCHVRFIPAGGDNTADGSCDGDETLPARPVLIVSEVEENQGMSICNAIEDLVPQLAQRFRLDLSDLDYFECWGPHSYTEEHNALSGDTGGTRFERVRFETSERDNPIAPGVGSIRRPRWSPFEREGFKELLGERIPPLPFEQLA
jgi:hypothetical protein